MANVVGEIGKTLGKDLERTAEKSIPKMNIKEITSQLEDMRMNKLSEEMGKSLKYPSKDLTKEISDERLKREYNNMKIDLAREAHSITDTSLGRTIKTVDNDINNYRNKGFESIRNFSQESPMKNVESKIPKVGPINEDYASNINKIKENVAKDPEKNKFQQKMDGILKQAIPITVGGGLVFSMFNRGGQMSNSELYGQKQQYNGY